MQSVDVYATRDCKGGVIGTFKRRGGDMGGCFNKNDFLGMSGVVGRGWK